MCCPAPLKQPKFVDIYTSTSLTAFFGPVNGSIRLQCTHVWSFLATARPQDFMREKHCNIFHDSTIGCRSASPARLGVGISSPLPAKEQKVALSEQCQQPIVTERLQASAQYQHFFAASSCSNLLAVCGFGRRHMLVFRVGTGSI